VVQVPNLQATQAEAGMGLWVADKTPGNAHAPWLEGEEMVLAVQLPGEQAKAQLLELGPVLDEEGGGA